MRVNVEVDPVRWARLLRRAHELAIRNGTSPSIVRDVVARSWSRSTTAHVDPDRPAPKVLEEHEAADRLESHPLGRVIPLVRGLLSEATAEVKSLLALSDADGVLLWATGHPDALESAVTPRFLPGHLCSEAAMGTNAVGTALALDQPVQIFSAEHFSRLLHGWVCVAAPIHDPTTGEVLGVLDLSGGYRTSHPHSLRLVAMTALMVEQHLARETSQRDGRLRELYLARVGQRFERNHAVVSNDGRILMTAPHGWIEGRVKLDPARGSATLDDGTELTIESLGNSDGFVVWQRGRRRARTKTPELKLETLGRSTARVTFRGQRFDLRRRHSDILTLLALSPAGLSSDELAQEVYGTSHNGVTIRAELSRLRRQIGDVVTSGPYRLLPAVRADFQVVERLLEHGQIAEAARRYVDPLLPLSTVPTVVQVRARLDLSLRAAVIQSDDAQALWSWLRTSTGRSDVEAHRRFLELAPAHEPRRTLVDGRLAELMQRERN